MKNKGASTSGFTLVELLVVIGIFGVILAGILKVFDTSNYTYKVQEEIVAMHQNVRVAKMFLERDVRMAGCGMKNFNMSDERIYALVFENASGATGSDRLTLSYMDYDAGACGSSPTGSPAPCDDLPMLTLAGTMPLSSAEAEVTQDLTHADYSAWDDDCYCGGTVYTQPKPGYMVIITAPDGSKSDVVFVTGVQPNSNKIQNGPNFTAEDGITYDNKILNSYPAGSTIDFFKRDNFTEVIYDIQDSVLRRNSEPIAEDIDDLQFAFGLDTSDDGSVDTWINDADLTDTEKDQVRSVRIGVLGRTAQEHRGVSAPRPALEDHAAGQTSDGYRRKLLQVTVKVRNLGL